MFGITFVLRLGAVVARIGPQLRQFSNGQPFVQGRFLDRHRLHIFHPRLVCTELGDHEWYRSGGPTGPQFTGALYQTAVVHGLYFDLHPGSHGPSAPPLHKLIILVH